MACICKTDSHQNPCPEPREAHHEGIKIHSGPDREGAYVYTVEWYDESQRRGKGQVFRSKQHKGTSAWEKAMKVYHVAKPWLEL